MDYTICNAYSVMFNGECLAVCRTKKAADIIVTALKISDTIAEIQKATNTVEPKGEHTTTRQFKPKVCPKCGKTFTPTGARQIMCEECNFKTEVR